jgi:endo-1,4-beta-D-glucanase Y
MPTCPAEPARPAGVPQAKPSARDNRRRGLLTLGGVAALLAAGVLWAVLPASAAESNLALNRPVTTSSAESGTYAGGKAVDGNATSRWASVEGHDPEWIRVDLGSSTQLGRVVLRWEAAYAKAYRVEVSADGTNFQPIFTTTTGNGAVDDLTLTGAGRYVRIYGTQRGTAYGYSLFELEIYGAGGPTPTPTASPTANPTPTASPTPTPTSSPGGPAVPFGSHRFPYVAGILKPSGAQATLDSATVSFYQKWKAAFIRQNCGNGWYEVYSPDADHDYVAEGQGYGMVITATMAGADPDAKKVFDGLVKFVLAHPSVNNADLTAAEQDPQCRSVNGSDSATDGDLDIAYGLLLADRQWGSAGTYDYRAIALRMINAIKQSLVHPTSKLLLMGDWSTSGEAHYTMSRTSDWLVDHFRAFRAATGDPAWDGIRDKHQTVITNLQSQYAPNTGLLPDFVINTTTTPKPAAGEVLESPNDGSYYWNACRDPWRIGSDAVTSGDSRSLAAARKLNTRLKGATIDSGNEPAFWAPFAVSAMTDPGSQAWLDSLWSKLIATGVGTDGYFSASIQLQVMVVASGNYWVP